MYTKKQTQAGQFRRLLLHMKAIENLIQRSLYWDESWGLVFGKHSHFKESFCSGVQRNATCTFFCYTISWAPVSLITENDLIKFSLFGVFLVWGLHSTNLIPLPPTTFPKHLPQDLFIPRYVLSILPVHRKLDSSYLSGNIGGSCDKPWEEKMASYSGEISAWPSRKGRPLSCNKGKCTTSVGAEDWGTSISSRLTRGSTHISPF